MLKTLKAKTPSWEESTEGRKAIAKVKREHVAARKAMLEEIARLHAYLEGVVPGLDKEVEAAQAEFDEVEAKLQQASSRRYQAVLARRSATADVERQVDVLETKLREGAHPGIEPFLIELRTLWGDERHAWRFTHPEPGSAAARIAEIGAVIERVTDLRRGVNPEAVREELRKIRAEMGMPTKGAVAA